MSTAVTVQINNALRAAAAFERTALQAEEQASKTYEMKMKSAGASAFEAFTLALSVADEFKGRKIDEKAIRRIYESTKPRPWWDTHLREVKVNGAPATREWAARAIQWHIDPEKAKARRAKHVLRQANGRKSLSEKRNRASYGARAPQAAPTRAEADRQVAVGTALAHAGRADLPRLELGEVDVPLEDLLGELSRISLAVRKVKPAQRAAIFEILRVTAREVERHV